MTVQIELKSPQGVVSHHPLEADQSLVLGRRPDADLVLSAADVSGRHARLLGHVDGVSVEDLGSTNGTWLEGRRLPREPVRLGEGEVLRIGGFRLGWKLEPAITEPRAREATADGAALVATIHARLIHRLDLRRLDLDALEDAALRAQVRDHVEALVAELAAAEGLPRDLEADALVREVLDEALGLGPLEGLLSDPEVSEIMVNGARRIYVERAGRLSQSERRFSSDAAVLSVLERIVAPVGRRIDESSPLVDARLADGSRVNAVIPPLAIDGPTITIRKFREEALTIADLVRFGSLTAPMARFLEMCVVHRRNVVISGGTGSGKTTTLNVLSDFVPEGERIITVEDAAELRLSGAHVVRLEARPPNLEGRGAVPIRELVRNCLRMRPDRIVVGECRGGEALDMLQAMNTGHEGSLTTLHANSPRDALARLETLVLMSGVELPVRAVREQIAAAVDVVVQQTRLSDGRRVITAISEVGGLEGDVVTLTDVFRFERAGHGPEGQVLGAHRPTGLVPRFYEAIAERGLPVDLSLFQTGA